MRYRTLSIVVATMASAGCYQSVPSSGECRNEHMQQVFSNDRQWKAVVFMRPCPGSAAAFQVP